MMIKFLRAKHTENIDGLPQEWPVKASPCPDDYEPIDGWEKGTREDIEAIKREHRAEYDQWQANKKAEQKQREQDEKASREASAKSAQAKLKVLQFTDEEIKKIMGSNYSE